MTEIEQSEQWRSIPGFPCYEASTLGRVRRAIDAPGRFQGRVLAQVSRKKSRYCCVSLTHDGREHCAYVHRLVLLAFSGPPPTAEHAAAHDDGDRTNNHLTNLSWKTLKENEADKKRHGTYRCGSQLPWAKLNEASVAEIRRRHGEGERQSVLAAEYGVAQTKISEIVNHKTWRHVA